MQGKARSGQKPRRGGDAADDNDQTAEEQAGQQASPSTAQHLSDEEVCSHEENFVLYHT